MFQEYPKWVGGVIVANADEEDAKLAELAESEDEKSKEIEANADEEAPKKRGRPAKAE